jgi:hypothetical protein
MYPDRPELITFDDGQLVQACRKVRRGQKPNREEREQLGYFGAWRSAVWHVEGSDSGSLLAILGAIRTCREMEEASSKDPDGDPSPWMARGEALREFLINEYRAKLPYPEFHPASEKAQRWADYFAQNRSLLPGWLRSMTDPPMGMGTRSGGYVSKEPPPMEVLEDASRQKGFGFYAD